MKHYTVDDLDRFRHGDLGPLATLRCRLHLWRCGACRQHLEGLAGDDRLLAEMRRANQELGGYDRGGLREDATLTRLERKMGGTG
jgi:hypothetical protein